MILTNTKYLIAICTILVLTAGGLVMVGPSADAEPTEYTDTPIKFSVDGQVYWKNVEKVGDNIRLPTLEFIGCDLADGKEFKGWCVGSVLEDNAPCYPSGTVVPMPVAPEGSEDPFVPSFIADVDTVTYTVTFVNGVTETPVQGVYGAQGTAPAVTPSEGFVFGGWFDADGNNLAIDQDRHFTIKGDATYTAQFDKDPVVTFVIDGTITYSGNLSTVVYPVDPVKDSFTFLGWSSDGDTVALAAGLEDGAAALRALGLEDDTTFSALFEPTLHTVTFTVDGVAVSTQTVKHGELATEPAFIPSVDGMDFVKWDFDFRTPVVADTEIKAVFTESVPPEPTGMDDPLVLTALILAFIAIGGVICMIAWMKRSGRLVIERGSASKKDLIEDVVEGEFKP